MVLRILILLAVSCSVAKAQVVLVADSLIGLPGSMVDAPVRVVNWQDVASAQGTVVWDPQVVSFDTVYQYGLPGMNPSNFGLSLLPSGKLTFSWNEANLQGTNLSDSTPIFVVRFTLTGLPGTATPIAFSSDPTQLEFVNSSFMTLPYNVADGEIRIEDTTTVGLDGFAGGGASGNGYAGGGILTSASGSDSWMVYPNPIRENSVVQWLGDGIGSRNASWNASWNGQGNASWNGQGNGNAVLVKWQLLDMTGRVVESGTVQEGTLENPAMGFQHNGTSGTGFQHQGTSGTDSQHNETSGTETSPQPHIYRIQWNELSKTPVKRGVYWLGLDIGGESEMKKVFIEEVK